VPAPEVGKPLPRGADAYVEDDKWHGYILDDDGHGFEWRRVFRIDRSQSDELWRAFADIALTADVTRVRPSRFGIGCATRTELTFNERTANVVLGWWYDRPGDPPRLVTAYPTP
jgi:hypothetical protein